MWWFKKEKKKEQTLSIGKNSKPQWEYWFVYRILREVCQYINIPMPSYQIESGLDRCYIDCTMAHMTIGLDIFYPENFFTSLEKYLPIRFTNERERIRFVIYHEVAHLVQFVKHKNWHKKYSEEGLVKKRRLVRLGDSDIACYQYRKLKTEANADKIALILFRKFNREEQ